MQHAASSGSPGKSPWRVVVSNHRSSRLAQPVFSAAALLLLVSASAQNQPSAAAQQQPGSDRRSTLQPHSPIPAVPCEARAAAVIANTGKVAVLHNALVNSYHSSLGDYGAANAGNHGDVRAALSIDLLGGVVRGTTTPNSPAHLPAVPIPVNTRPLPLGAKVPGQLLVHRHESITLRPGNYIATDVEVEYPGEIKVFPAGLVSIFVTGHVILDGIENPHGKPADLQFIVMRAPEVRFGPQGTFHGLLYAPRSDVEVHARVFGSIVGASVRLEEDSAVHFDENSVCPGPSPKSPAIPPAALPPPPPAKVGCYKYTRNGWQNIACATKEFIDSHFPRPDAQLTMTSSATQPLVFGQVEVTLPAVDSENNAFLASTAGIEPSCQSTGNPVANQWSIQSNTNQWTIGSGPNKGDTAQTQFVIQSDGSLNSICIWNIDATSQGYDHQCVVPNPKQRSGGLQAFDSGNIAATTNANGTLSMVASLSWVQSGDSNIYGLTTNDTYGLAAGWSVVSGGILGEGACSQAQFTNAEAITQVLASTCAGDTQPDSPTCPPPTFQPNASVSIGPLGTVETNNLTAVGQPSLAFLNSDLAVSNLTATTSGTCLGPSHGYVKDSASDFGGTPSTIGDQVFWESPDIFLVPHGTPVDLNAVSTESTITPGGNFDIWVRVHNDLGCADVTNVKSLVYLADPAAISVQWDSVTGSQYVGNNGGATGVTVPAGGQALIGPIPFTAPTTGIGDGHRCILAAIEGDSESAVPNTSDAPDFNQVAQRNIQFGGACEYPLTNATTSSGNAQLTLSVTPISGTIPSLTSAPDVEVAFDDGDSSWFNVWNAQSGNGSSFSVKHSGSTTTVRLGAYSVALNPVPLAAGQSRNATGTINPGSGTLTLQIAATLTDSANNVLVTNGGSCTASTPVIQ